MKIYLKFHMPQFLTEPSSPQLKGKNFAYHLIKFDGFSEIVFENLEHSSFIHHQLLNSMKSLGFLPVKKCISFRPAGVNATSLI